LRRDAAPDYRVGSMPRHLLAIDQGTTGSTALVVSDEGEILGRANREFPQHYPQPGWVEHDPEELMASVHGAIAGALEDAEVPGSDIAGIGISNQRETTLLWERETGRPLHRAIVWQDRRTADRCARLEADGHAAFIRERTGLVIDPYFSGTKLAWLLDHVDGARARARAGELTFGTVDTLLVHRLTGGAVTLTEVGNASRTQLLDLETLAWNPALAEVLDVPMEVLPEVRSSAEVYGETRGVPGLPDGVPIAGIAGDQQAALFGQACLEPGESKCTYGTGAFLLLNTGGELLRSEAGLLTTVAWTVQGETSYALEGSSFVAGAAVTWLRDRLGLIERVDEIEALAASVPDSGGVTFVPALAGLGAPYWDPDARGVFTGLGLGSTRAHLARAVLEGIAFQTVDLVDAMRDTGADLSRLRVDGGAASNDLLMQFQADLLGVPVDRPAQLDTTAFGAAFLAGLALGVFDGPAAVRRTHRIAETHEPSMEPAQRDAHLARWRDAVGRARSSRIEP
jgi:glycerol kinase